MISGQEKQTLNDPRYTIVYGPTKKLLALTRPPKYSLNALMVSIMRQSNGSAPIPPGVAPGSGEK